MKNPWLGLKSYEEGDHLYGRGKEADELANIVMNSFHTIIYGKSGIGKTSLLRAGVFPTLRYEDFLPIYIRLEHDENADEDSYLRQIENALKENQCSCSVETERAPSSFQRMSLETHGSASLQSIFARYKFSKSRGIELTPVIVFDQFEEIFTLNENRNSAAVDKFFADLSDILNNDTDSHNYRIVFCLREDYLYYIERLSESIPAFKRNRYCLQDLTHDEAMEVITLDNCNSAGVETRPATSPGTYVDVNTAEEILRKISPDNAEEYNATILSLYMSQLFDKMVKAGATTISSALVQQFGDDIISTFYFDSIAGISEKSIEYLEDHLVTTGGYRHNIPLEDAITSGVRQPEIDHLKERRIINIQPRQGNILYMEYAHDVLCPIIVENRSKRILKKKAKRQRRLTTAAVVGLLLVLGIMAGFIWQNRQIAQERDSMKLMQSRAMAGQAAQLFDEGEYAKGIALCLKALPEDWNNPDRPKSYEALATLYTFFYFNSEDCRRVIRDGEKINSATFSPDSKFLVTTSKEGSVKMWSMGSGKLIRTCKGHTDGVSEAIYSNDGRFFVTGSADSTARIWDASTGKLLKVLRGHKGCVIRSVFSPDDRFIATTSCDSTARIWNAATGKLVKTFRGHNGNVYNPSFTPDGQLLMTTSLDSTVRIWNVATGSMVKCFKTENYPPSASFSPDGKYLALSVRDKIELYNVVNFKKVKELKDIANEDNGFQFYHLEFSPDGKYVQGSGGYSGQYVWNVDNGKLVLSGDYKIGSFTDKAFSPDSRYVLEVADSCAIIRDVATGERTKTLKIQTGYIYSAKFSPNGRYVATIDQNGETVIVSDLQSKERVRTREEKCKLFASMIVCPDGKNLYCASGLQDTVVLFNITANKKIKSIVVDSRPYHVNILSPDLKHVAFFNPQYNDTVVQIWNTENGKKINELRGHKGCVKSAVFSPNGQNVLTTSNDSTAIMWNVLTGKRIYTVKSLPGNVISASFSADGRYVATASNDSTARIWNAANGKLVKVLKGHTGAVNSVKFSLDGKWVVTTSKDSTARIWSVATGEALRTFRCSEYTLHSADFSPNGKYLVTVGPAYSNIKNAVRVWEVETGKAIQILDHFEVSFARFTNDGKNIETVSQLLNTYKLWHFLEPQEVIDHFRKVVGDYEFTEEEEIKYYLK